MSITKQVNVLLASGADVVAERTFPHPYHYRIVTPHHTTEITADDIVVLLEEKRIVAPHVSEWGDGYRYRVIDPVHFRVEALKDYSVGFGRCGVCGALPIAANASGTAKRHGFTKTDPACDGSGMPLLGLVSREPVRAAAA